MDVGNDLSLRVISIRGSLRRRAAFFFILFLASGTFLPFGHLSRGCTFGKGRGKVMDVKGYPSVPAITPHHPERNERCWVSMCQDAAPGPDGAPSHAARQRRRLSADVWGRREGLHFSSLAQRVRPHTRGSLTPLLVSVDLRHVGTRANLRLQVSSPLILQVKKTKAPKR